MWNFFEKRPFFRADMAGLGKYCTGGYGRIGVYRVNSPTSGRDFLSLSPIPFGTCCKVNNLFADCVTAPPAGCTRQMDMTLILDLSGSVEEQKEMILNFARRMARGVNMHFDRTRVAAVAFADNIIDR